MKNNKKITFLDIGGEKELESKYYPPKYEATHFHCPYCNVYSEQNWCPTYYNKLGTFKMELLEITVCHHCNKMAYWFNKTLMIPDSSPAPLPHEDLPDSIKPDYLEARSIVNKSPRGAAALLRLCLQKLLIELGEGKDINNAIGSLVKKGLPEEVQQALDIVRVIGNESVHPGELDIRDDQDTAIQLFELINFIVEERISRKKKIGLLFSRLPEGKKKGIAQRDN